MALRQFAPALRVTSQAFRMTEWLNGMRTVALVVFSLAFPYPAVASSSTSRADSTKTLEWAILLAGAA